MMQKLRFNGETKLTSISKDSAVRVVIEISLPPPQDGQPELNEARRVLAEIYGNIAEGMANYLGATQHLLIENPRTGVASADIICEHIKKSVQEVMVFSLEIGNKNSESEKERDFLKSYQ